MSRRPTLFGKLLWAHNQYVWGLLTLIQEVSTFGGTYVLLTIGFYKGIKIAFSQAINADTVLYSAASMCAFFISFLLRCSVRKSKYRRKYV